MIWKTESEAGYEWQTIEGKSCVIYLEKRPPYCDRGNFLAKIFNHPKASHADRLALNLDGQDGWPRYYFDEARAKAEIEAWLVKRKQALA